MSLFGRTGAEKQQAEARNDGEQPQCEYEDVEHRF